jgi:hypothetical protein
MSPDTSKTIKITMCLGSMDHTPSEQLGDPQQWHTTVLILSEGAEHWDLATDIARKIGCKDETLKKWAGKRAARYRREFECAFTECVTAYPVHIRAISAQGKTITSCFDHMSQELGLRALVRRLSSNDKPYLEFGPFLRISIEGTVDGKLKERPEPANFIVSERQGVPLIFMAHFLFRMYRQILTIIQRHRPEIEWVDWQLMPNKFPGDIDGPMAQLFHAMMSGAAHARLIQGDIRVVMFAESRVDHGSVLADNLAGLLAQKLENNETDLCLPEFRRRGASFFWEIWAQD